MVDNLKAAGYVIIGAGILSSLLFLFNVEERSLLYSARWALAFGNVLSVVFFGGVLIGIAGIIERLDDSQHTIEGRTRAITKELQKINSNDNNASA